MRWTDLLPLALALVLALVFTPGVRAWARRWGAVAQPRGDRWHKKPTALLGGIGIFAAVAVTSLTMVVHSPQTLTLLGASAFLWLVGLVDDLYSLKPYQKLIGQVMGAAGLLAAGMYLPWTPWLLANWGVTLIFVVGITNALNLLDNMDGLAAGIGAIAAAFLGINRIMNGQAEEALLLGVLAAALVGFLAYNSNPASIFMGDCGSMFIGFFLAGAALLEPMGGRSTSFLPVLAVPMLVLFIPIFDVCLVTVMRKLAGRAVSQGGRDHTSHRLVALGLSERRAVFLLYGLAILSGVMAVLARGAPSDLSLLLIGAFTVALTFLGIYIARIKVYAQGEETLARGAMVSFLVDLSYKRRVFEVLLDVVLICLAYAAANILYYGPMGDDGVWSLVTSPLPLLVFLNLGAFLVAGVYRGLWRYIGLGDLLVFAKGVALGSVLCVLATLALFRFDGFSRTVFAYHTVLLFLLLVGSRVAFRLLRTLLPSARPAGGRRTLIFGAGDAGTRFLVREMNNNPGLGCIPVGFLDDDPHKTGKLLHGFRVFGGNGSFTKICDEQHVDEVYISSLGFSAERVREIQQQCREKGIRLKRMRISFEVLDEGEARLAADWSGA